MCESYSVSACLCGCDGSVFFSLSVTSGSVLALTGLDQLSSLNNFDLIRIYLSAAAFIIFLALAPRLLHRTLSLSRSRFLNLFRTKIKTTTNSHTRNENHSDRQIPAKTHHRHIARLLMFANSTRGVWNIRPRSHRAPTIYYYLFAGYHRRASIISAGTNANGVLDF